MAVRTLMPPPARLRMRSGEVVPFGQPTSKPPPTFPAAVSTDANLLIAQNQISTTLVSPIAPTDTLITVADPTAIFPNVVLTFDTGGEIVKVLSGVGSTFTVQRGFDNTVPLAQNAGAMVTGNIVAFHHNTLVSEIEAIEAALGPNLGNVVQTPWRSDIDAANFNLLDLGCLQFTNGGPSVWVCSNSIGELVVSDTNQNGLVWITQQGQVGIRTMTPSIIDPTILLNVWGDANFSDPGQIMLGSTDGLLALWAGKDGIGTGPQGGIGTYNDSDLVFWTNNGPPGSVNIILTATGRVGIGPQYLPAYMLDVDGDINTTGVFRVNGVPISGGGGSQTPWLQNIDGAGYELINAGNVGIGNSLTVLPDTVSRIEAVVGSTAPSSAFAGGLILVSNQPSTIPQVGLGFLGFANYAITAADKVVAAIQSYPNIDINTGNLSFWTASANVLSEALYLGPLGTVAFPQLPSIAPAAGSKQIWYDPADSNRVKFVP